MDSLGYVLLTWMLIRFGLAGFLFFSMLAAVIVGRRIFWEVKDTHEDIGNWEVFRTVLVLPFTGGYSEYKRLRWMNWILRVAYVFVFASAIILFLF